MSERIIYNKSETREGNECRITTITYAVQVNKWIVATGVWFAEGSWVETAVRTNSRVFDFEEEAIEWCDEYLKTH